MRTHSDTRPGHLDEAIFERINELANEEEHLYEQAGDGSGIGPLGLDRLEQIAQQLDQCYDLLQQREGRRLTGRDPARATVRPAVVVEDYQQ